MTKTKNSSMSGVRKGVLGFCALSTIGLMAIEPAFADCTRHFYNATDRKWLIDVIDNKGQSDLTKIGPNQTVAYTYTSNMMNGTNGRKTWASKIRIMGPSPENYTQTFPLNIQPDGDCVHIEHPGMSNTGSATVNEPANGDVQLWRAE